MVSRPRWLAAASVGVDIDGYETTVGVTAAMVAMFTGLVAVYGWFQRSNTKALRSATGGENRRELVEVR